MNNSDDLPRITVPGIQLVGISGKAGSGKDTVADYITRAYESSYIYPFADPLKQAAAAMFGLELRDFHKRDIKEMENPYWGVSPRRIAQFLGTECVRDGFHALLGPEKSRVFWIHRLCGYINGKLEYTDNLGRRLAFLSPGDTVIIPDVRFQNEYDWVIRNKGIIIQLFRRGADGGVGIEGHQSELGFVSWDKERTFICDNNGSLQDLYLNVDGIMKTTEPSAENMEL